MTSVSKYNAAFYHDRDATTRHAAVSILGLVRERLPFCSVADLGCGVGTWLEVALELGAKTAFGWEGDWVESDMMVDNRIAFTTHNLELPLPPTEPVDLDLARSGRTSLTGASRKFRQRFVLPCPGCVVQCGNARSNRRCRTR